MRKWLVWFKIQAGNHAKNKLLNLLPSVKTNFSFACLKFLDTRLHTLGLNIYICKYIMVTSHSQAKFQSQTYLLFVHQFCILYVFIYFDSLARSVGKLWAELLQTTVVLAVLL